MHKSRFDVVMLVLVAYTCIIAMYNSAFQHSTDTDLSVIAYMIEILFVIDLILNFFHAYRDPESLVEVRDLTDIARHYCTTWFIPDLIAVFPFQFMIESAVTLKLFRLFRFPRVYKLLDIHKFKFLLETLWK